MAIPSMDEKGKKELLDQIVNWPIKLPPRAKGYKGDPGYDEAIELARAAELTAAKRQPGKPRATVASFVLK